MKRLLSDLAALAAGMLLFIGLPLLGWGLGDLNAYFQNPARVLYIPVLVFLQILAVLINSPSRKTQDKDMDPGSRVDLFLIKLLGVAVVLLAPLSDRRLILSLHGEWIRYAGLVLTIPAFILMETAEIALGRQFSIAVELQDDHRLIRHGPYRWIRHPRYLGIGFFFLGISLVFRSLLPVSLTLALLAVLIWRIFKEEKLLAGEFGGEWEDYQKHSWRLIPFLF